MAYLHCHSCDWSQDDFWDWRWTWRFWKFRPFGYNPISLMIDDIRDYIKPRYIEFDSSFAREHGFKSSKIHSWSMLLLEWKRHFKRIFNQKWWTYNSWKKDKDRPFGVVCPACKDDNFDID